MNGDDSRRLTYPVIYLVRMLVFLILAGFCIFILNRQIATAFMANPGLNGLILGVLAFGILLGLRQVIRLFREVKWANALLRHDGARVKPPILLAPVAQLMRDRLADGRAPMPLRNVLDIIGARLDESRDTARYLTGLLIFLGLLGTFWGLLATVGSIGGVINSMQTGADAGVMFDDLKNGLVRADRRHEHFVHLVAVRPRRLARPRLSRSAGGTGAKPLLHRTRGQSHRASARRAVRNRARL